MLLALLPFALGPLAADLDDILDDPALRNAMVGVSVVSMDGAVLYERNADVRMIPASNQKLLTCAFALETLGSNYRPSTRFWRTKNGVVIDAPGDPMITNAQLKEIRKRLNVKARLPVLLKQAYRPGVPPSWEFDDMPNKYAAPVTAFTVDRGSFELWASGRTLFYLPQNYGATAKYFGGSGSVKISYDPIRMVASVSGRLPGSRRRLDTLALAKPDEAAASILGGPVSHTDSVPKDAPDARLQGSEMREMVAECLSESDNNIAEHLLLMAALKKGKIADDLYEEAAKRLKSYLVNTVGVGDTEVGPADGSGLSRHNNVTPAAITTLLTHMASTKHRGVWMNALAAPGKGTLSNRLPGSDFSGKTGTLNLASALSGYVKTADGSQVAVSIIFNHYPAKSSDVRQIQDRVIRRLAAGTLLAKRSTNESDLAHAQHSPSHGYWPNRHDYHGLAARKRLDRRNESSHARLPVEQ